MVAGGNDDAVWLEPTADQNVMCSPGVGLADEQINVAHRPESWVFVHQVRECGAFQDKDRHLGLRHRFADLGEQAHPNGSRVRMLRSPRQETSPETVRNREPCPLDVCEHERLHAVLLGGSCKFLK